MQWQLVLGKPTRIIFLLILYYTNTQTLGWFSETLKDSNTSTCVFNMFNWNFSCISSTQYMTKQHTKCVIVNKCPAMIIALFNTGWGYKHITSNYSSQQMLTSQYSIDKKWSTLAVLKIVLTKHMKQVVLIGSNWPWCWLTNSVLIHVISKYSVYIIHCNTRKQVVHN